MKLDLSDRRLQAMVILLEALRPQLMAAFHFRAFSSTSCSVTSAPLRRLLSSAASMNA